MGATTFNTTALNSSAECHYAECHKTLCNSIVIDIKCWVALYVEVNYTKCHYTECHYAESVIMLSVITLSVITQSVIMLSVVAPSAVVCVWVRVTPLLVLINVASYFLAGTIRHPERGNSTHLSTLGLNSDLSKLIESRDPKIIGSLDLSMTLRALLP